MANKTPTSNMTMCLPSAGGPEDNSLESAIRMCIASGSRPTRLNGPLANANWIEMLDALRDDTVAGYDLINNLYGTKGVRPTQFDELNGFPKPTITMNFEQAYDDIFPNERHEELWVDESTLNNIIGFDVIVTLEVDEYRSDTNALLGSHTETIKFNKGGTAVSSSPSGMPYTAGKGYRVSDYAATAAYDVDVEVTSITADNNGMYYDTGAGESSSHSATLGYIAAATKYAHLLEGISELSCAGTAVSPSEFTAYSYDSVIANGSVLYTSTAMTTTVSNDNYFIDKEDDDNFYYGQTISGVVSNFGTCFA